jgi:hypothetical protein
MGKGTVALTAAVSLMAGGGAAWCHVQARALQVEAQWLMERGRAQAEEYSERLDGAVADAQLKTFAQRRAVLERAHQWQRGEVLGVMAAALGLVGAYGLFLLKRLDDQLADALPEVHEREAPPASPEAARALATAPSTQR